MYSSKNDANHDKVIRYNHENIKRAKRGFTGKVLTHWKDGELMEEEETVRRKLKNI